jgi:type II restriction enzyme
LASRIAARHFGLPEGRETNRIKIRGHLAEEVVSCISQIMIDLESKANVPDYFAEGERIKEAVLRSDPESRVHEREITSDLYLPDAGDWLLAVEMKTPKVNESIVRGEKRKLLELRALLFQEFPGRPIDEFKVCFGFSYNPYKTLQGFRLKWGFGKKILDYDNDLLVGKDFWDFIGGEGTYESLLDVVRQVGRTLKAEDFK